MNFPDNLKYTKDHEWILIEGDTGTVGITDYAQGELGDIVFVELPENGKVLGQGDSFGSIEAVKAVSDLYAPVSGSIIDSNKNLEKEAEVVNKDPYGNGWMIKLKMTKTEELSSLLDADSYRALVGQ